MAAILIGSFVCFETARADTQYGPSAEGKTYQNNWTDNCRWFDSVHVDGDDPCYKGVWSDTYTYGSMTAKVNEYAFNHSAVCSGESCSPVYVPFGAYPASAQALAYAAVNHYCVGWPFCYNNTGYHVNVRGYAHHWNNSIDPINWWTTSDGY